jgi:hypothetical protein
VPWASLGKRLEWSVLCRTLYRVRQPQRRGGGEGVLGFSDYNTYSIPNLLYKKWHDPGSYVCRQKVTNIT